MSGRDRRWFGLGRPLALLARAAVVAALLPVTVTVSNAPADGFQAGGLRVLGELPMPVDYTVAPRITAVDAQRRRMYVSYGSSDGNSYLVTYDLTSLVPRRIGERATVSVGHYDYGSGTPFQVAFDQRRQVLYYLGAGPGQTSVIYKFDIRSGKRVGEWLLPELVPGFYGFGISYSAVDDRLYLVGEMATASAGGNSATTFGRKVASVVATVVAFDPNAGAALWTRPVPQCQQALNTLLVGALVVRSEKSPTVYFACATGGLGLGDSFPGQSGLVEMRIDPKASSSAAAAQFDVRYHPVSGSYYNGAQTGIAAFDPVSDRFMLQSLSSTTPGTWVFDGKFGGWVGFITAVDDNDFWNGINTGTGHYYMGGTLGGEGGIVVSNVRTTPIQAGEAFRSPLPGDFMAADPGSRRVFVNVTRDSKPVTLVVEDLVRDVSDQADVNYDEQTEQVKETTDTFVSYAGGVSGFGALVHSVGGIGGATSNAPPYRNPVPVTVSAGTRAVAFARVPTVDLRYSAATGSAAVADLDANTANELESDANTRGKWPYEMATCNDGGGTPGEVKDDESLGKASAVCDLDKATVTAKATHGVTHEGVVTFASASFDSRAFRDPEDGIVSMAAAEVRGLSLVAGDVTVKIGKIRTDARTAAHGRIGTSTASWSREVSEVEVRRGSELLLPVQGCTTTVAAGKGASRADDAQCRTLEEQVNRLLPMRVRVDFPTPQLRATPKGAFATVRQNDADFYQERTVNDQGVVFELDSVARRAVPAVQVEVFHDATERSRTLFQAAAVEVSAIYTISTTPDCLECGENEPPFVDDGDDTTGTVTPPITSGPNGPAGPATPGPSVAPPPNGSTGTDVPRTAAAPTGLVVSTRGLGEAVLMAAMLLLFGAAVGTVLRRMSLLASTRR